jgi:hypothetical protein
MRYLGLRLLSLLRSLPCALAYGLDDLRVNACLLANISAGRG